MAIQISGHHQNIISCLQILHLFADILCSSFYFGSLVEYVYMHKLSHTVLCRSTVSPRLSGTDSVLAPVISSLLPPNTQPALIGQLTHPWASAARCVFSRLCPVFPCEYRHKWCICVTWWHSGMSRNHRRGVWMHENIFKTLKEKKQQRSIKGLLQ